MPWRDRRSERSIARLGPFLRVTVAMGVVAAAALAAGASLIQPGHARAAETLVPVNLTPPTIYGTAELGLALKARHGKWTQSPTSYSYRWQRCNPLGVECKRIIGATSQAYFPSAADLGATLRVVVTAINAAGSSKPARSVPSAVVTDSGEVAHLEYVFTPGKVHVYSIDERFKEVESFSLPDSAGVRGVDVCPANHVMYVSYGGDGGANGNGSVLAYNLVEKRVLWTRSYSNGVDSGALTLDCSKLFEPTGENTANGIWWVLNTGTGEQVQKIETAGSGPHDTVTSADGKLILLGGRNYNRLPIYNTVTGTIQAQVGPLAGGVRPLTINGLDTIVFTIATGLDGFQVSSALGVVLYTENFGGTCAFSTCSHGISVTPDSKELAVIDAAHKVVQFWDVHEVAAGIPPAHLANVAVAGLSGEESPCAYDCGRSGWVQHSFDGRYVFVGDSGDVIESATHEVIAHIASLENSRQSIEIDWHGGVPIATTGRTGVGH